MKQAIIKLSAFCILFAILLSTISISVYAYFPYDLEGVETYIDSYATTYFSVLKNNFGVNSEGSCGYVAAAMLLSYYDSYWNETIISENYDSSGSFDLDSQTINYSPGVKKESTWVSNSTYPTYHDYIDANYEEYFHLYLMKIARDELHYENRNTTSWGATLYEIVNLIKHYLYEIKGFDNSMLTVNYTSYNNYSSYDSPDDEVRDIVIQKIESGIPVLFLGFPENQASGHFLIAYDYDSANDTIYFHSGWHHSSPNLFDTFTILSEESVYFN